MELIPEWKGNEEAARQNDCMTPRWTVETCTFSHASLKFYEYYNPISKRLFERARGKDSISADGSTKSPSHYGQARVSSLYANAHIHAPNQDTQTCLTYPGSHPSLVTFEKRRTTCVLHLPLNPIFLLSRELQGQPDVRHILAWSFFDGPSLLSRPPPSK